MLEAPFPSTSVKSGKLDDGTLIKACKFCRRNFEPNEKCQAHYRGLRSAPEGFYQCPFGFTTRVVYFDGAQHMLTGIVAYPRFNSEQERDVARKFPETKTSREEVDRFCAYLRGLEELRAETIKESAKIFPQAFHELRKLNAEVVQHAELERRERDSPRIKTILSAAELMRNNFEVLEALANIENIAGMPVTQSIHLKDLLYKVMRVYERRANGREMWITVMGEKVLIRGNQKFFPVVPTVLLENAIRYGRAKSQIKMETWGGHGRASLIVSNFTDFGIDPLRCFEKGTRFAENEAEGSGYGLFLAKEIVKAHGGDLKCNFEKSEVRMIADFPLVKVLPN